MTLAGVGTVAEREGSAPRLPLVRLSYVGFRTGALPSNVPSSPPRKGFTQFVSCPHRTLGRVSFVGVATFLPDPTDRQPDTLPAMSTENPSRFQSAFRAWKLNPVELTEASAPLYDVSQSLCQTQLDIAPLLEAYHDSGIILPPPVSEVWYEGMSYITGRNIRQLRRHLQTGRNQIASRELLAQAETLKAAWDAYRSVTGK